MTKRSKRIKVELELTPCQIEFLTQEAIRLDISVDEVFENILKCYLNIVEAANLRD